MKLHESTKDTLQAIAGSRLTGVTESQLIDVTGNSYVNGHLQTLMNKMLITREKRHNSVSNRDAYFYTATIEGYNAVGMVPNLSPVPVGQKPAWANGTTETNAELQNIRTVRINGNLTPDEPVEIIIVRKNTHMDVYKYARILGKFVRGGSNERNYFSSGNCVISVFTTTHNPIEILDELRTKMPELELILTHTVEETDQAYEFYNSVPAPAELKERIKRYFDQYKPIDPMKVMRKLANGAFYLDHYEWVALQNHAKVILEQVEHEQV